MQACGGHGCARQNTILANLLAFEVFLVKVLGRGRNADKVPNSVSHHPRIGHACSMDCQYISTVKFEAARLATVILTLSAHEWGAWYYSWHHSSCIPQFWGEPVKPVTCPKAPDCSTPDGFDTLPFSGSSKPSRTFRYLFLSAWNLEAANKKWWSDSADVFAALRFN